MITEELLKKYLSGNCTAAEQQQIAEWYASFDSQPPYFEDDKSPEAKALKERTKATIQSIIASHTLPDTDTPATLSVNISSRDKVRKSMFIYAGMAAAVLIVLMAGIYWVFFNRVSSQKEIAQKASSSSEAVVITPGANKAMLTLADGSVIVLDSAQNGVLVEQGNTNVIKNSNGELVYKTVGNKHPGNYRDAVTYNMLSTPRGGQFMLTLPDKSKVWLNAASSIKYPTVFAGNERRVEITGEAYFEIEKDPNKPFRVDILLPTGKGGSVEVLGTHFNINAYNDESSIKTTLLEGKVKVTPTIGSQLAARSSKLLSPGQQAQLNSHDEIKVVNNADIEATMAWKNGLFQFDDVTIQAVLNQVARWYDVEVVYERDVSKDRFRGKIYRNTDIAKLLKILELSGAHFKIEGKRIIVQ
ncbi:FecR family protein [Pseudoflavitalea sp. X16]|uniref:FecR family protein n=1 Tax=Paraflavitalea devenefica TaxID=2716334 RepID=UPI00141E2EB4|nr:FecR domain-containing protein [Paraflavitalea devenefica]NII28117.1 FecR family protein [Paraflavitalea devenefica]